MQNRRMKQKKLNQRARQGTTSQDTGAATAHASSTVPSLLINSSPVPSGSTSASGCSAGSASALASPHAHAEPFASWSAASAAAAAAAAAASAQFSGGPGTSFAPARVSAV